RLRAIPLGYLGEGTHTVAVAIVDPEPRAVDELAAKLGGKITPYVVPELRALYYLEKHFGLPRRARFVRSGRVADAEVADDRRRQQPASGIVMPPAFTLEPRKRRPSQAPMTTTQQPTLSYGAACERIDTATHREHIAEAFVEYAKGRCDALVVFLIR